MRTQCCGRFIGWSAHEVDFCRWVSAFSWIWAEVGKAIQYPAYSRIIDKPLPPEKKTKPERLAKVYVAYGIDLYQIQYDATLTIDISTQQQVATLIASAYKSIYMERIGDDNLRDFLVRELNRGSVQPSRKE